MKKAVILGACGQMGTALASILAPQGMALVGVDCRSPAPRVERISQRSCDGSVNQLIIDDVIAPGDLVRETVETADAVIMALPFSTMVEALDWLGGRMKPGSYLVETCSVKSQISNLMSRLPDELGFIGINPLFAPSLSWAGREIFIVQHRYCQEWEEFLALINATGVHTTDISAENHDKILAYRQGAVHAAVLGIGSVLWGEKQLSASLNLPIGFGPPPYQLLIMLLSRIVHGDPHVYAEIQSRNPFAADMRADLRHALTELDGSYQEVLNFIKGLDELKAALVDNNQAAASLFESPFFSRGFCA